MSRKDGSKSQICKRETKAPQISPVVPDGGWGWLVALGSFIMTLIIPFNEQVYSILYAKLFNDSNTSTATIAWIFNIGLLNWNLSATFTPTFCAEFGWRKVVFSGGITLAASFVVAAFLDTAEPLFFAYSVLYGFGAGLSINVWSFIIPRYFEKRRGRVIGVVTCGLCAGQFVAPLLVRSLQESYGSRGAILIMGGIYLNVCVSAVLFHPVEWHLKGVTSTTKLPNESGESDCKASEGGSGTPLESPAPGEEYQEETISCINEFGSITSLPKAHKYSQRSEPCVMEDAGLDHNILKLKRVCNSLRRMLKSTVNDVALLRQPRVFLICFSYALNLLFYVNYVMLIPLFLADQGFPVELSAYCISVLGIANVVVRIVVSSLTDFLSISARWYFMGGVLVVSASVFAFVSATEGRWMLTAMAFYGMGIGSTITVNVPVFIEVMGMDLLPSTMGTYSFVTLFMSPCVGPVIGYIRDATQDYSFCLKLISSLHLVPLGLMALVSLALRLDVKRQNRTAVTIETFR